MSIGSQLENLMNDWGVSQRELSRETGISAITISRYRTGRNDPKATILHEIAEYFGVSMDYFWE